jgi:NADH-quinone oxidoreductase subunit N
MIPISSADLLAIIPELVLFGGAMVVLILDAFAPEFTKRMGALVGSIIVFSALLAMEEAGVSGKPVFGGTLHNDAFTHFVAFLVLLSAFLVAMISWGYTESRDLPVGEYMAGLLVATGGMLLISRSANLIVIFVALEILSIALYMMIAYRRTVGDSVEAGLKYFILGAYASAFFIFGATLIYGATGSIVVSSFSGVLKSPLGIAGLVFVVTGLGFKISAVPFHMWTPDVYQGAPPPVTAFLASASKVAGFAALMRIVYPAFGYPMLVDSVALEQWRTLWPILAILTMTVGNIIALVQEDLRRVLAYSSIAHVGFVLMAMAGGSGRDFGVPGAESALFYLLSYALASIGAFGVLAALPEDADGRIDLNLVRGLAASNPGLAGLFTLFLLSLAGVPPLVGFAGKFLAFRSVLQGEMYALAIMAALNSALAFYYYLRIIVRMYMENRAEPVDIQVPQVVYPALSVTALGVFLFGILPSSAILMARLAARALMKVAGLPTP